MLMISELAAYAGVTVRAVRHYHAKGLLPEPERDRSGYRRYDAAAVVDLIRIRTLADAGVPLARIQELLVADEEEFAAAVEEIDRGLRAEIRERQRHRERITQLAAGDSLALPPEVVAYLDKMRALGLPEQAIEMERDGWILIAAQLPTQMPALMEQKQVQLDNPALVSLYHDLTAAADWEPDDPRMARIADRLVALIETEAEDWEHAEGDDDFDLEPSVVELLDSVFIETVPPAARLMELLRERGWAGWTKFERIETAARFTRPVERVRGEPLGVADRQRLR